VPRFWVVVDREETELYRALLDAFWNRPAFSVVLDRRLLERRTRPRALGPPDRRSPQPDIQRDKFLLVKASHRE
jgi:hypothetical protein